VCAATTLLEATRSRVIDEHTPHQTSRDAVEVRTVAPADALRIDKADERFVD
jgi:hypothetical protein